MAQTQFHKQAIAPGQVDNSILAGNPATLPGWTTPTLTNSATAYGSTYGNVQYMKYSGIVYIRGLVANNASLSTPFMTLPVGYRPAQQLVFSQHNNTGPCRLDIDASGNVVQQSGAVGTNSWVSVNLTFVAEQ